MSDVKKLGISHPQIIEVKNAITLFTYLELGHGYTILSEDVAQENPNLDMLDAGEVLDTWVLAVWKKDHTVADILMDNFTLE